MMPESAIHRSALDGFSARADAYAKGRPDYPPQVAEWLRADLRLGQGKVAFDLGAGTGKFLPYLAATGATVMAIEPVAAMRSELSARQPAVTALEGSATQIPAEDATADAVVCAQSFHWFATREALAEIRRVLKPGGALGLIWNNRDTRTRWVAAIETVTEPYLGDTPSQKSGAWRGAFPAIGFGPLFQRSFAYVHRGDPESVIISRMLSVSYIAALPPEEQGRVITRIRAIIAESPELAARSEVAFPYRTTAYHCVRM